MRKHIVVDEKLFIDFNKTSKGTHNDILYKLLVDNKKRVVEEDNVIRIINKMFIESNNIIDERLKSMDKSLKNMEEMFKYLKPMIDKMSMYEGH